MNRRSSRSRSSSSRRRKKLLKSFFSIGFRSYIKHFLGAILLPFRPSLPWCFPIRELPFEQKESGSSSRRKRQLKSSFSMGFRSYIRHFLGANLLPFRPSLPWCFPIRELPFEQKEQQEQKQQQQEEKIAKIILFDWFQKLH